MLHKLLKITTLRNLAIFDYDYSTNNWASEGLYWDDSLNVGKGYFLFLYDVDTTGESIMGNGGGIIGVVDFTSLFSNDPSVTLSLNNSGDTNNSWDGWQLDLPPISAHWYALGNPFSEPMDIATWLSDNSSSVNGNVVYLYYRERRLWYPKSSGSIYPGEGFMIGGTSSNVNITHRNPSTYSSPSPAPAQPEDLGIKFSVLSSNVSAEMYANQSVSASDGFDTKDAFVLFGQNEQTVEPYFIVEGRQVLANKYNSDNYTCPIAFHSQNACEAKLFVENIPAGTTVSIVDLFGEQETVLEEATAFDFSVLEGENTGRYQIKIIKNSASSSLVETSQSQTNISVWNNNKNIFIEGKDLKQVEIYNTLGQIVYSQKLSGDKHNFVFNQEGAYIVKVSAKSGNKSHKMIIKK